MGERKCWLSFGARQQRGEEIQLLIFQNLHQPQVATHYKTIHTLLHHVRTSLSISTPILFPFRLYLRVSTSDFSQSMVKLSPPRNSVGSEIRVKWSCKRPPKATCAKPSSKEKVWVFVSSLHRNTSQEERKLNHFSWVVQSIICQRCFLFWYFAVSSHPNNTLLTGVRKKMSVVFYSKATTWRFNSLFPKPSIIPMPSLVFKTM